MTLEQFLSLPKSFYVSWRLTSFREAFRFPAMVKFNTKLISLDGQLVIDSADKEIARLIVGFNSVGIYDKKYSRSILQIDGCISLRGKATFGQGARICVIKGALLTLGHGFNNTAEGAIICRKNIKIGQNCLMSWETIIMDSDWHAVRDLNTDSVMNENQDIVIEDNCWLGMRSMMLKGSHIAHGSIVAAHSTVTRTFDTPNVLLAGTPAIVKKSEVILNRQ
jgi:acetyltransferase-like isoleucine patch superfamily enzyme